MTRHQLTIKKSAVGRRLMCDMWKIELMRLFYFLIEHQMIVGSTFSCFHGCRTGIQNRRSLW